MDQTSAIIGCFTVALVILVEILRHKLDHAIAGHRFAKVVVEACYRELTTLGIVECGVFTVHKVNPDFSLELEAKVSFP